MPLMAPDWTQQTRFLRVMLALFVGAFVGASLETGWYLFNLYSVNGREHFFEFAVAKGRYIFSLMFIVLFVALVMFGAPVWFVLHERGRRRWQHAILAGAIVSFIVFLAFSTGFFTGHANGQWSYYGDGGQQWVDGVITPFGWMIALKDASKISVLGAILGLVIWRVAYRRVGTQD